MIGESAITGGAYHAFSYHSATHNMTDLGTLGGDYSGANGINTAGTIVGQSQTSGGGYHGSASTPPPTP